MVIYQIKGTMDEIEDTVKINERFNRRHFIAICQNNPDRLEYLKFELHQNRCKFLDHYNKGDRIIITFELQGNKWTDNNEKNKFYNTLKVWKIEKDENPEPWLMEST